MPRLSSACAVWVGWAVARVALLALIVYEPGPMTDVNYYFGGAGQEDGLREYPHAATWVIYLLHWLTAPDLPAFQVAFLAMNLLIDALFLALLLHGRLPARQAAQAGWFWVFFGTACGQVLLMRLDLIPAVLVGAFAALLFLNGVLASVLLAAATAVKLWPGVLGAGLVGGLRERGTWVRVTAFFAALAGLVLITLAVGGLDRLLSPLTYQGERGLQVESVAATVAVAAAQFRPELYDVHFADSKSWEIAGPGVDALIGVADAAMVAVVAGALGWALFALWRGRFTPSVAVAFGVAVVAGLLVANKVFSPQYVIWLGPILAVALRTSAFSHPRWLGVLAVAAAALSTVIYPFFYGDVLSPASGVVGVVALIARNVLVVVILIGSLRWLRAEMRAAARSRSRVTVR